jgi:type IV pilus assembly protein PilB
MERASVSTAEMGSAAKTFDFAGLKRQIKIPPPDQTLERAFLFHEGRALEARGRSDEAIAAYRRFIDAAPQEPVGYAHLAAIFEQRGEPDAAADVYAALAEMHAAHHRWDRAAAAYARAADLVPDDMAVLGALRDAYIKLGQTRSAAQAQARLDAVLLASPNGNGAGAVREVEELQPEPPPAPPAATVRPAPAEPIRPWPAAGTVPPAAKTPPPPALPTPPPARPEGLRPSVDGARRRTTPDRSRSLGQILLDEGYVTREQLERGIQMQQRSGGHLGRILVDIGAATEEKLAQALSIQWGMAVVDLSAESIDPDAVKLIPQHLALRYKVIPIGKNKRSLKLAIADPLNVPALDDVRLVTGLDIEPVIAPEEAITAAIAQHYSGSIDLMDEAVKHAVGLDLEVSEDRGEEISLDRLRTMVEEAPVVRVVNLLINQAVADGASDIHIEPQKRNVQVRYRVDGMLRDVMNAPKAVQAGLVSRVKIMANLDIAERRVPQDGRIHVTVDNKEFDLRVSTLPTVFGEKVVMRLLDQSSTRLGLNKLGFAPATLDTWQQMIAKPYGMILVSGPTGSGKTTTLYSTLHRLNTADKNILTVEDPVEYQLARVNQVQVNPRAGVTFASALRSFLRQDPDIIMVGEIRDRETAEIAIQASLTGHLVLSTIHTNDAPTAATRLVDMGIEPFLISSSVIGILAQRLVRTICRNCHEAYHPPVEALHRLGVDPKEGEDVVFYRGKGCDRCKGSGYRGRMAVFELMTMSDAVRDLILRGASATAIRDQAIQEGMRTLRDDGVLKVLEGITTVDELLRVVFVES